MPGYVVVDANSEVVSCALLTCDLAELCWEAQEKRGNNEEHRQVPPPLYRGAQGRAQPGSLNTQAPGGRGSHRCLLRCEHGADGDVCVKLCLFIECSPHHEPAAPSGAYLWCWRENLAGGPTERSGLDRRSSAFAYIHVVCKRWRGRNHQGDMHSKKQSCPRKSA